jgi:hypothetical protein
MTYYNNRVYTITEVDYSMTPMTEFTPAHGKKISFANYVLENYKIKLQYPKD